MSLFAGSEQEVSLTPGDNNIPIFYVSHTFLCYIIYSSIKTYSNLYFLSCLDPRRMLHVKYVSGCQFVEYIFFFGFCIGILFIKRQVKSKSLKISRRVS